MRVTSRPEGYSGILVGFRRRAVWAGALLLCGVMLVMFEGGGRLFFGHPDSDLAQYFYPQRVFLHRHLQAGIYPLWNPHLFSGLPVLETQQASLFHPVALATAWFPPAEWGLLGWMAANVALAWGLTWWAFRRGARVSRAAAVIGASAYVFGVVFSTRVIAGHFTVVAAMAWMPLGTCVALRIAEQLRRMGTRRGLFTVPRTTVGNSIGIASGRVEKIRRELRLHLATARMLWDSPLRNWMLLAAVVNAVMVLSGAPQYVIYLFWMQIAVVAAADWRRCRIFLPLAVGVPWIAAALLSCPQWFPTLHYLPFTGRSGMMYLSTLTFRIPLDSLLELLLAFPFGDDLAVPHLNPTNVWESALYPGLLALVFSLGLLLRSVRYPRGIARTRAALALIALGIILCTGFWLPGLTGFREPMKARVICAVGFALAAALGWDALGIWKSKKRMSRSAVPRPTLQHAARHLRPEARPEEYAAAGMAFFSLMVAWVAWARPEWIRDVVIIEGVPLDPLVLDLWMRMKSDASILAAPLLPSALRGFGLALAVWGLLAMRRFGLHIALVPLLALGLLEPWAAHRECYRSRHCFETIRLPDVPRMFIEGELAASRERGEMPWRTSLPANWANRSQFHEAMFDTGGYDPLMPDHANNRIALFHLYSDEPRAEDAMLREAAVGRRYDFSLWNPACEPAPPAEAWTSRHPYAAIADVQRNIIAGAPEPERFGPVGGRLHFVVPPRWAGRAAPAEVFDVEFLAEVETIRAAAPQKEDTSGRTDALEPGETLRSVAVRSPNRHVFESRLDKPALLVLRTTWLPGWRVRIDDGPARQPGCANHWMLAMPLPPGAHTVTFVYRPVGFDASRIVAALTALLLVGLIRRGKKKLA